MKIATWNCNGAFRKKLFALEEFDLDITVVQECENPQESTAAYKTWAENYLWLGDNKNKGIGVFAKNKHTLKLLNWSNKCKNDKGEEIFLESFLPCLINDEYILIAVWTKNKSRPYEYIGQFWKYLQIHKCKFKNELKNKKIIILGDFNSNILCDKKRRHWNHSDVVEELEELNIKSLYHLNYKENQGKESIPTFYLYKNIEKPYHLDHVFISKNLINKNTKLFVPKMETWLEYSDHLPLVFKF